MAQELIGKELYEAILGFDNNDEAKDCYYEIMDKPTGKILRDGTQETVRDRVLIAYGMLFCEDTGLPWGKPAGADEVADTADRLYIGSVGYDADHWYRMKHRFAVIDDDNYDRFAALVISDLRCGELHEAAVNERKMLVVGEADPLHMTSAQRKNQQVITISFPEGGVE